MLRPAITLAALLLAACADQKPAPGASPPTTRTQEAPVSVAATFHTFQAVPLGGQEPLSLAKYKGSVLLVANVAAHCGYTPQYGPLGEVERKYAPRGLRVLGFVSDDFGHQAGSVDEVKACSVEHKATFDQFNEIHVKKGPEQHPLFAWLTSQPDFPGDVKWNFNKWLVGRSGELLGRWSSDAAPDGPEITAAIERSLGK
jgi:glutathione peroxidase